MDAVLVLLVLLLCSVLGSEVRLELIRELEINIQLLDFQAIHMDAGDGMGWGPLGFYLPLF